MGETPFKHVLIHGLVRDSEGRKMSKSLGNGIDPLEVIDQYGADALRFMLATGNSPGNDMRFYMERVEAARNFANKLWNASRFVLMNIEGLTELEFSDLKEEDKWILTKLNNTIKSVTKNMEHYEFNNVGSQIYSFVWNDFCDNYIEFAKFSLESKTTKSVLYKVLSSILKMLHPFMPYVTDELYNSLPIHEEDIILSKYPEYNKDEIFTKECEKFDNIIEFIKVFRNVKLENKIGKDFGIKINSNDDYSLIFKLLRINPDEHTKISGTKYSCIYKNYNVDLYYEKEITEEDMMLKNKQISDLEASIARRKNLLSNENYLNKAPKELVEKEKITLKDEEEKLAKLKNE